MKFVYSLFLVLRDLLFDMGGSTSVIPVQLMIGHGSVLDCGERYNLLSLLSS